MTEIAIPDPLTSNCLSIRRSSAKIQADETMKRKTPSELRGEQLKRRTCRRTHDSLDPFPASDGVNGGPVRANGLKKTEQGKTPKYIDTRVDEVFPVKKSSNVFKILSGKENIKDTIPSREQSSETNPNTACDVSPKDLLHSNSGKDEAPNVDESSAASAKHSLENTSPKVEKCSQSIFRSVAEISLGSGALSNQTTINMDEALKGLVAREFPVTSQLPADSYGRSSAFPSRNAGNFFAELQIPGRKTPLDFTLKTTLRLVSSSPLSWCHRLGTNGSFNFMTQFALNFGWLEDQKNGNSLTFTSTPEVLYSKALLSWSYPQSSLPPSVISALTLSAARGETDFLLKRQEAWEDSFRCLYYMLRKNMCDIFYFYTPQFVVMFIGGNFFGESKCSCSAYLSQSTRGLRSLLLEHGIGFSMPVCHSEDVQVTAEDLVELSEIEKSNLGQTRQLDSMSNVDNTSLSLLAFTGNENVHGLYDFLLNHRSFLNSLIGIDVPVLYSPVPFQNASLSIPEVRCKEMKRADAVLVSSRGSNVVNEGGFQDSAASISYSVEIKDTLIPPWTVSGVCAAMGSEGKSFDAREQEPHTVFMGVVITSVLQGMHLVTDDVLRLHLSKLHDKNAFIGQFGLFINDRDPTSFVTEANSVGLNAALGSIFSQSKSGEESKSGEDLPASSTTCSIPEASAVPCLQSAYLRGLKYVNGSYLASLSPM